MGRKKKSSMKTIESDTSSRLGNSEEYCHKIEYAMKTLERTDSWINNCDSKVSILIGIWGVALTIILATDSVKTAYTFIIENLLKNIGVYKGIFIVFAFAILGSYVNTLRHIIHTLLARIDSKKYIQNDLRCNSNIFFGSIVQREYDQYKKSFINEKTEDRMNDVLSQIYINSTIATTKYKNFNNSLIWSVISAVSTLLIVIWAIVGF